MPISRRVLLGVGAVAVAAAGLAAWRLLTPTAESLTTGPAGDPADPRMAERAIGKPDAKVTVREFFSLTCSHCAAFHRDSMPRIKRELIDTGRLRMVFHDFPLDQLALTAAAVARTLPPAGYEPFVAALLASQERWAARGANSTEELAKMAALAGLGRDSFNAAIADQPFKTVLLKAQDGDAKLYGIESTPSFVFSGPAVKDRRVAGAIPFADFAAQVAQAGG